MRKAMISLICLLCVLLTGCYTKEEKALAKQYTQQAKINATNYIKEKYGFKPKILGAQEDTMWNGWREVPRSGVVVQMKYKERKFLVRISGGKETTEGRDNYQRQDIQKDVEWLIEDELGVEPYRVGLDYGSYETYERFFVDESNKVGLVETYYDGTNLKEVLDEGSSHCVAEFIDGPDLSLIEGENTFQEYRDKMTILLVNYKDTSGYNRVDTHYYNILKSQGTDRCLYENAYYIKEALQIEQDDEIYYDLQVQGSKDFDYYAVGEERDVVIGEMKQEIDIEEFRREWVEGLKMCTDIYQITSKADEVYIYIPEDLVRGYDKDDLAIGLILSEGGEIRYLTYDLELSRVGDLYVKRFETGKYDWCGLVIFEEKKSR
ncbi:MAG: hypothetical protein ACRDDX_06140 [Cellulosilyticaceae bacterium]